MATDPTSGYVFVETKDSPLSGWIEKKRDGVRYENAELPYDRVNGSVGAFSSEGWEKSKKWHAVGSRVSDPGEINSPARSCWRL